MLKAMPNAIIMILLIVNSNYSILEVGSEEYDTDPVRITTKTTESL